MKSKKLNLEQLKVKSFMTDLEKRNENFLKGGCSKKIYVGNDTDDDCVATNTCKPKG